MKLLVTGGSGFIGSNFIDHWLMSHPLDFVINLDLMTYAANPLTVEYHKARFKNYRFVLGDIIDENLVDELVSKVDLVVHFAAESHVDRSVENPGQFVKTNILGTYTLLEAAKKYKKRFHHISTDEVFGSLELNSSERFNEKRPMLPRSPYSASKAGSDHLVMAYHETYGLPITISNCSNNYGPYQFPEKVIPLYITRSLEYKLIPIYGKGRAVRDYLYVGDHVKAIESIIFNGKIGETYCVGGDSELNTLQVANIILDKLERPHDLIRHTRDRPGHDPRYAIDHTKITRELGWKPLVNFQDGIELTIDWYSNNKDWWGPIYKKAEEVAEKYLEPHLEQQNIKIFS